MGLLKPPVRCRFISGYGRQCLQRVYRDLDEPMEHDAIGGFCGLHTNMAFTGGAIVREIVELVQEENPDLAKKITEKYNYLPAETEQS